MEISFLFFQQMSARNCFAPFFYRFYPFSNLIFKFIRFDLYLHFQSLIIQQYTIKMEHRYFVVEDLKTIQGQCTTFISKEQQSWRTIQELQQYPYQRVAKYCRNIEYTSENTRTVQTLVATLNYLLTNIWPLLNNFKAIKKSQIKKISYFIYERLKSIRCEYFVQGIIYPAELLKIIKATAILDFINETDYQDQLIGLQHLINIENQERMEEHFLESYREAIKYAVLTINPTNLQKLINDHQSVFQDLQVLRILKLRIKIQSNNYFAYYQALERQNIFLKCLLWRKFDTIKQRVKKVHKKSIDKIVKNQLYKMLGLKQEQGWISLKANQNVEGQYIGYEHWINKSLLQAVY